MKSPTRKVRIELEVPVDLDNEEILARMHDLAIEWYQEHEATDEDLDLGYPARLETLTESVSVEEITE